MRTETQLILFEKRKYGKIQFIYLCPVEGVAVYFSDAVVVQVPAISHKIVTIKGEKLLTDSVKQLKTIYCITYIVTYSFVIPLKAFGGISSRYRLSQISLQ